MIKKKKVSEYITQQTLKKITESGHFHYSIRPTNTLQRAESNHREYNLGVETLSVISLFLGYNSVISREGGDNIASCC